MSLSVREAGATVCPADPAQPADAAGGPRGCHWYVIEGGGAARLLTACTDQQACTLTAFAAAAGEGQAGSTAPDAAAAPAFAGAVLVVSRLASAGDHAGASSPLARPAAIALARMELLEAQGPRLSLTVCNIQPRTLSGAVALLLPLLAQEAGAGAALPTQALRYSVPPYSCANARTRAPMQGRKLMLIILCCACHAYLS